MSFKHFLKKFYLVIGSVTLVLLSSEAILRLVPFLREQYTFERFIIQDPQEQWEPYIYRPSRLLGYERIPGCQEKVNSYGLIGREFDLKKEEDTYRILVLGDSIVEQNYFIEYLREEMNKISFNTRLEFINAGVAAYKIWQNASYLKYYGIKFDPDLVLVSLCLGAFSPERMVCYKAEEGIVEAEAALPKRLQYLPLFNITLLKNSYLYRLFILGVANFLVEDEIPNRKKEGINRIGEIRELCRRHQIPCFAFIWPYLMPQSEYDETMNYFYSSMTEALDFLGFDYIDLHKYFPKDNAIKALRIAKDDYVHPSEEGHKIAAEAIFKYLLERNYFE